MKYLVTGKEMKLLDKNTSDYFKVPELVLMEQAAMHFVWRLCDILKETIEKNKLLSILNSSFKSVLADYKSSKNLSDVTEMKSYSL